MNVEKGGELTTHHNKKIATGALKASVAIFLQISDFEGGQKGAFFYIHCFRYWIWYRQNENMLGQLQEVAPETYAFFSSLAANGWTR